MTCKLVAPAWRWLCALAVLALVSPAALRGADDAHKIPVMDGGLGTCSLELTVNGTDSKPVYDAKVKVHIAYGFGGFHKLDLEAGTNVDGKVKFTGLPDRVRRPPLEFHAAKDDTQGMATYDPASECQGKHDITLSKGAPQAQ
jgi:hypothetical protein